MSQNNFLVYSKRPSYLLSIFEYLAFSIGDLINVVHPQMHSHDVARPLAGELNINNNYFM